MTRRDAILSGVMEATRLHQELHTEEELRVTRGPVNVVGALVRKNAIVIYRPLEGLLGACIPTPRPGVLISTKRPLAVQRFTAGHELGHVVMHHPTSIDTDEILNDDSLLEDTKEIQANAFAAAFLIPRWLLNLHGKAQGWNKSSLEDPMIVYQLSLRVGASYAATVIALNTHRLVDEKTFVALRSVAPKTIKQKLLRGYEPENWYRDVWLLSERDEGTILEGQPDDLFLFRLSEKSGAGYLWDIEELRAKGFAIVRDTRTGSTDTVGGSVQRVITAQSEHPGEGEIHLALRRPWQRSGAPVQALYLRYDLRGKEEGLPRVLRRQLEAA